MSGAEERIVLRDTPTEMLLLLRAEWVEMLAWGLSKDARKSIEIKVKAIDHVLRERERGTP